MSHEEEYDYDDEVDETMVAEQKTYASIASTHSIIEEYVRDVALPLCEYMTKDDLYNFIQFLSKK